MKQKLFQSSTNLNVASNMKLNKYPVKKYLKLKKSYNLFKVGKKVKMRSIACPEAYNSGSWKWRPTWDSKLIISLNALYIIASYTSKAFTSCIKTKPGKKLFILLMNLRSGAQDGG